MRTASCYTNKVRVETYARVTKVEYPGRLANNFVKDQAAIACNPNYIPIQYSVIRCGKKPSHCKK